MWYTFKPLFKSYQMGSNLVIENLNRVSQSKIQHLISVTIPQMTDLILNLFRQNTVFLWTFVKAITSYTLLSMLA